MMLVWSGRCDRHSRSGRWYFEYCTGALGRVWWELSTHDYIHFRDFRYSYNTRRNASFSLLLASETRHHCSCSSFFLFWESRLYLASSSNHRYTKSTLFQFGTLLGPPMDWISMDDFVEDSSRLLFLVNLRCDVSRQL
ncbi:hypothetical protein AKJ16_DCAP03265 [Drosera capensis]